MPRTAIPQIQPIAETRSLLKQVVDGVRWEILSGHLPPGTRLKEMELCEQLGVSRPLLREAFQRLSFAGLIEVRDRQGARVVELSPTELSDVLDFQTTMFEFISRLATLHGQPAQKQKLLDESTLHDERTRQGHYESIREFTMARYAVQHHVHVCTGSYYRVNKRRGFVTEIQHPHSLMPYRTVEQQQASSRRWLRLAEMIMHGDAEATAAYAVEVNTAIKKAVFEGLGLAIPSPE